MSDTPSHEKCPECGATVPDPGAAIGTARGLGDADEWAEPTIQYATCAKCETKLTRSIFGGPHPWERTE